LPGLESSNNNKIEEDKFYDEMMSSLLKIVLNSILINGEQIRKPFKDVGFWEYVLLKYNDSKDHDSSHDDNNNNNIKDESWKNLLKWKLFTRYNRNKVQLSCINKLI